MDGGLNLPFYKITMVLEKLSGEVEITFSYFATVKSGNTRKKGYATTNKGSILSSLWARYQDNGAIKNQ